MTALARLLSSVPVRRPDAAGRRALTCYDRGDRATRAHVAIRWISCPMPAIERVLPASGRILEIGCGHGLFSIYAAQSAPGRTVRGIDIDAAKIAQAQLAAAARSGPADDRVGRTSFGVADGGVPAGPWDAIVVVDVLYLFEPAAARDLLTRCVGQLAPGGVLVVKEMARTPRWKARWNRFQEWLAVKVVRITEGDVLSFVSTDDVAEWAAGAGLPSRHLRLDRGRLHPHALVLIDAPQAQS